MGEEGAGGVFTKYRRDPFLRLLLAPNKFGMFQVGLLGGCQNYGPFLDPHYGTAPNI